MEVTLMKIIMLIACLLVLTAAQCGKSKAEIAALEEQLRQAQAALLEANEKADIAQCESVSLNNQIVDLRGEILIANNEIVKKNAEIVDSQLLLDAAQANLARRQAALVGAQADLRRAQQLGAAAELAAQRQVGIAQANLAAAQAERNVAQASILNLRAQLAAAQNTIAQAQAAIAANQAEIERHRALAEQARMRENAAIRRAQEAQDALNALRAELAARAPVAAGLPGYNVVIQRAIDDVSVLDPQNIAGRDALENAAKVAEDAAEAIRRANNVYTQVDDMTAQARKATLDAMAPGCYINRVNDAIAAAAGLRRPDLQNFPSGRAVVNNIQSVEAFLQAIENECVRINAPLALNGLTKQATIQRVRNAVYRVAFGAARRGWAIDTTHFLSDFIANYVAIPTPFQAGFSINFQPTGTGFAIVGGNAGPGAGGIDVNGVRKIAFSGFARKLIEPDVLNGPVNAAAAPFAYADDGDDGYSINSAFDVFGRCNLGGEVANAENCYTNIGTAIGKFLSVEQQSYAMLAIPLSTYIYERLLGNDPVSLVDLLAVMKVQNSENFYQRMETLAVAGDQVEYIGADFDFFGQGNSDVDANIQRLFSYNIYEYVRGQLLYDLKEKPGQRLTNFLTAFSQEVPLDQLFEEVIAEPSRLNNNTLKLAMQSTKIDLTEFLDAFPRPAGNLNHLTDNYDFLRRAITGIVTQGCPPVAAGEPPIVFDDFLGDLVQWWTGARVLPQPPAEVLKIEINRVANSPNGGWQSLPNSHTCFNSLEMPDYTGLGEALGLTDAQIIEHMKIKMCVGTQNGVNSAVAG